MKRRVFVCPITVFSFSSKGMDLFSLNRRELDGTGPCNKKPEIKTGLYRLDFLIRERVCSTLIPIQNRPPNFLFSPRISYFPTKGQRGFLVGLYLTRGLLRYHGVAVAIIARREGNGGCASGNKKCGVVRCAVHHATDTPYPLGHTICTLDECVTTIGV